MPAIADPQYVAETLSVRIGMWGGPVSGWQDSTRRDRLPPEWPKLRKRILKRDGHQCQTEMSNENICGRRATQVDHIRPGDDHREENLEAICEWHHKKKSSREGNAARRQRQRQKQDQFRVVEDHPGWK